MKPDQLQYHIIQGLFRLAMRQHRLTGGKVSTQGEGTLSGHDILQLAGNWLEWNKDKEPCVYCGNDPTIGDCGHGRICADCSKDQVHVYMGEE